MLIMKKEPVILVSIMTIFTSMATLQDFEVISDKYIV